MLIRDAGSFRGVATETIATLHCTGLVCSKYCVVQKKVLVNIIALLIFDNRFNGTNHEKVDIKNIWFSEFLKYLTQSKGKGIHDKHWETYVNLCAPCEVNYTYIASANDMINEADMILNVTGAGKVVHFPRTRYKAEQHKSLSVEQVISQWRSIPDSLFKAIIDRYSIDMRLFGYKEPKLLDDYIKTLK